MSDPRDLCSWLPKRGRVTSRLLVRFEGENQKVSIRPHLGQVVPR